ncbi:MAG: hypothetical protein JXM73_04975 [Anaerolineae bacterium]|nr:hypothetical protein [Anaerolineae bacterium]
MGRKQPGWCDKAGHPQAARPIAPLWPLMVAVLLLTTACHPLEITPTPSNIEPTREAMPSTQEPTRAPPPPTAPPTPTTGIISPSTATPGDRATAAPSPTTGILSPSTATPSDRATAAPPPTATASGPLGPGTTVVLETNEGVAPTSRTALGELSIEYPLRMNAGTSNFVVLQVYIPAMLASLSPLEVERVEIPEDAPAVAGTLNTYQATIMVGEMMRIELHSLTFDVEELYPAAQRVDLDEVNKATIWSWEIKAPGSAGAHVVTVRAYVGDEARPVWVRSLEIEVVGAAPTPGSGGPTGGAGRSASPLGWAILILLSLCGLAGLGLVVALRRRPPAPMRLQPDLAPELAGVRQFLLDAFGAEELRRLCQDDPQLRPILYDLDQEPSPNEVVDAALNYCQRHGLIDHLLALVRQQRPAQYAQFASASPSQPGRAQDQ